MCAFFPARFASIEHNPQTQIDRQRLSVRQNPPPRRALCGQPPGNVYTPFLEQSHEVMVSPSSCSARSAFTLPPCMYIKLHTRGHDCTHPFAQYHIRRGRLQVTVRIVWQCDLVIINLGTYATSMVRTMWPLHPHPLQSLLMPSVSVKLAYTFCD